MNLHELGMKYYTDKAYSHTFNGRSFLDVYERYLNILRGKNITMLEIGVLNGSSLGVWKEYFGDESSIIGLDIDPAREVFNSERIKIYIGSQNDEIILDKIVKDHPDGFDFILDDGSHINELTIASFNLLFKHIKPGGFYIIEDTHCTYGQEICGDDSFLESVKTWPGMFYNTNIKFDNNRQEFEEFFLRKIKSLDLKNSEIFGIYFYSETMIIEKIK